MGVVHPVMQFDPVAVLAAIPDHFLSDGCSGGPDRLFGRDLTPFCRAHDAAGCTRLWPPGTLTQEWRHAADRQLGREVRAALPFGARWIGWIYWWAVHRFGGVDAYDSCEANTPDGLYGGVFCRHGIARPEWQQ